MLRMLISHVHEYLLEMLVLVIPMLILMLPYLKTDYSLADTYFISLCCINQHNTNLWFGIYLYVNKIQVMNFVLNFVMNKQLAYKWFNNQTFLCLSEVEFSARECIIHMETPPLPVMGYKLIISTLQRIAIT